MLEGCCDEYCSGNSVGAFRNFAHRVAMSLTHALED